MLPQYRRHAVGFVRGKAAFLRAVSGVCSAMVIHANGSADELLLRSSAEADYCQSPWSSSLKVLERTSPYSRRSEVWAHYLTPLIRACEVVVRWVLKGLLVLQPHNIEGSCDTELTKSGRQEHLPYAYIDLTSTITIPERAENAW